MSFPSQYDLDKALVSKDIEYALKSFGKGEYDKFIKRRLVYFTGYVSNHIL